VDDIDSAFDVDDAEGLEDWSPALHLSSICVTWRNVARCTAQIWRVIRVPLLRNPVNIELLGELSSELFSLSGHHTLSLGLFQNYCDDDYSFGNHIRRLRSLDDLLAITRAVTSRCNDITFHGLPLEQIDRFWGVDTPNLKKIRILEPYGHLKRLHGQFPSNNVSLLVSPHLEEIEITSATRLLPSLEIIWDNITTAKMEDISLNNAFEILLLAPRLKTCRIYCREFQPPEDDDPLWLSLPLDLPLTHITLESLDFRSPCHDITQFFFHGVNLPSLKEFEFDEFRFGDNARVKHLISFFQRSPCPLTSLSLFLYFHAADDDILNLLTALLPTLTHFSINVPGAGDAFMTDRFLQELVQPTSGSPKMVAPRLETFSYTGPLNFTWPAFLKIFDPPPTSILDTDFQVKEYHKRPLRDVSLQLKSNEAIIIDDDALSRLREIQVTVNLKIVRVSSGQITPII
jgi:hypothetical protein